MFRACIPPRGVIQDAEFGLLKKKVAPDGLVQSTMAVLDTGGNLNWTMISWGVAAGICFVILDEVMGRLKLLRLPPLGVGIGLATGKHAVCFVGDGGSLFSIHALWTAAKYAIPSIFVCFVNHEYRLLKDL